MDSFTTQAQALASNGDLESLKALIDEAVEDKRKGFGPPLSEINTAIDLEQKLKRKGEAA